MVYQHLSLIPTLTVLENLMMGTNPGLILDRGAARARLAELASALGVQVDPDVRAGSLALGQQQHDRDHQGALERLARAHPRRAHLDAHAPGRRGAPGGAAWSQGRGAWPSSSSPTSSTRPSRSAIGSRCSSWVVWWAGWNPRTWRRTSPQELQERIVTMMFGEAHAPDADIAELREATVVDHPSATRSSEPMLELIGVSAIGADGQHGISDVSLTRPRRRGRRCRRHRRQRTASARGGDRRSASRERGRHPTRGRLDHRHERVGPAAPWGSDMSRTTASARASWPRGP